MKIITDVILAIQNASDGNAEILSVLLEDRRATNIGGLLVGLLGGRSGDQEESMIRSKQINLEEVPNEVLSTIIETSRSVPQEIEDLVLTECTDYNECHFNMLLREIVVKKRDFSYYLDWLIERLSRDDTSKEARDLFSDAAGSLLSKKKIIHTSDLFTAYSGFFLLANSSKREDIMNTLADEEGVTEEGLKLAGMLLEEFFRE